jgi:hypothetical protein
MRDPRGEKSAEGIVRKIGPLEGAPIRAWPGSGADGLRSGGCRVQDLEQRGEDADHAAAEPGRELRPERESEEAPEDHVEEAACMIVYPRLSGACVELGGEAQGHDHGENEKKARPHGEIIRPPRH